MPDAAQPFTVQTPRLRLSDFGPDDWRIAQAEWGVPQVARMMSTVRAPWAEDEVRHWIDSRRFSGRIGFGIAIRTDGGTLIGTIGIGGDPVKMGYLLGPKHWGQGYASEAIGHFVAACFDRFPKLVLIEAEVMDDNPASARVLLKNGFRPVGHGQCNSLARLEPVANTLYRVDRTTLKALP